jgi:threonine dehydratase
VDAPDGSVIVVSGGNVDPAVYAEILARATSRVS